MGDNDRQIIRNEETVVAGQPEETVVSQTQSTTGSTTEQKHDAQAYVAPATAHAGRQSSVQTTTTSQAPSDRMVAHNYAERVVDPAAEKAAAVDWVSRFIWLIVGIMVALLAIRFVLLLSGADPNAGFAQLIYGLTGWMVAPFNGLFGSNLTYEGAAGTGVFAPEILVAIVVYILIGWLVTKLASLMLGTNRTTGTVISDTERQTKV